MSWGKNKKYGNRKKFNNRFCSKSKCIQCEKKWHNFWWNFKCTCGRRDCFFDIFRIGGFGGCGVGRVGGFNVFDNFDQLDPCCYNKLKDFQCWWERNCGKCICDGWIIDNKC